MNTSSSAWGWWDSQSSGARRGPRRTRRRSARTRRPTRSRRRRRRCRGEAATDPAGKPVDERLGHGPSRLDSGDPIHGAPAIQSLVDVRGHGDRARRAVGPPVLVRPDRGGDVESNSSVNTAAATGPAAAAPHVPYRASCSAGMTKAAVPTRWPRQRIAPNCNGVADAGHNSEAPAPRAARSGADRARGRRRGAAAATGRSRACAELVVGLGGQHVPQPVEGVRHRGSSRSICRRRGVGTARSKARRSAASGGRSASVSGCRPSGRSDQRASSSDT